MDLLINRTAIHIINTMGVTLCFLMLFGNRWLINNKAPEGKSIRSMIIATTICCIVNPFVSSAIGRFGYHNYLLVKYGTAYGYFANILISSIWIVMVIKYLYADLSKRDVIIINSVAFLGISLVIINFFYPILFKVDAYNNPIRQPLFLLFVLIDVFFAIESIRVYVKALIDGGDFMLFPFVQFMVPITLSMIINAILQGATILWPFVSVAICGIVISMQNLAVFHDSLTSLYNRFYFDSIIQSLQHKHKKTISAILIDLNSFKAINDNHGHSEGDDALVITANILRHVVSDHGAVIRFAGDEFIVLMQNNNEIQLKQTVNNIYARFDEFNQSQKKPYTIEFALGYDLIDLQSQNGEDILNILDSKMYENKKEYYTMHPEVRRRGGESL